jgi:hypothetical protein
MRSCSTFLHEFVIFQRSFLRGNGLGAAING